VKERQVSKITKQHSQNGLYSLKLS